MGMETSRHAAHQDMPAKFLLILAVILISVLYVSLIFNQNIWTDEAFTIDLVSNNTIYGIISGTANDVHPPLYYLIAKVFVSMFGSGFQVYKIVSIVPVALTMFLSVIYIRPWFGTKTALLFLLFFNAIPSVMEYGVQIRMYSWSIFFITAAGLSAYGAYTEDGIKHWYILSLSALCACYTHNFAMISAVWIYVLLGASLIMRKKSVPVRWLLSGMLVGICFIPWLFVLLRQTSLRVDNYWIEPITANTIMGYFSDLYGSRLPFTTVMFAILLIAAVVSGNCRCEIKYYSILLLLIPLLTTLVGVLVSVLITPFFIARYLIPCMGLVALALAIGFGRDKSISFGLLCVFLVVMIGNSYYTNYIDEYCSTHTDELLDYLDENLTEKDIILYNNQLYGYIYACYFDKDMLCFLDEMDFNTDYETIWYFDSCISPWLPDTVLAEHGLTKEYIATTGIEQNDFILYKIHK
ncbi:MAG: glycosyltransferase family 39 protein [Lachnospiraceae bacterium]|nr:glycosyltransferase family 39 protein [Lachnospiraceae bacterium]